MTFKVGYFVITPEKIRRAMVALVSYGQPKIVQISYLETFSAGKSGTSGFRAGCSRMGLPDLAATSKIGQKRGSSRQAPLTLVWSCKPLALPLMRMRSGSLTAASGVSIGHAPT